MVCYQVWHRRQRYFYKTQCLQEAPGMPRFIDGISRYRIVSFGRESEISTIVQKQVVGIFLEIWRFLGE